MINVTDILIRTAWNMQFFVTEEMQKHGANLASVAVGEDGSVDISYVFLTESTALAKNGYYAPVHSERFHKDAIHWFKVIGNTTTVEELEKNEEKRLESFKSIEVQRK